MGDNSVKVKLTIPISVENKKYESFDLSGFKVSHMQYIPDEVYALADTSTMTYKDKIKTGIALIPLIGKLADVDEEVIMQMSIQDMLMIVDNFYTYFSKHFS